MSFKEGDRVKIPKGVEGTVRFVGKVGFASGIHVGVELDTPAGDNDGKKKGKRYFSCKRKGKYGIIEKAAYFTAVKGKKGRGKRSSISNKGKKGGRASKAPKNLSAITDEPEDDEKDDGGSKKGKKGKKGASRATPPPAITTTTIGIQTEAPKEMLSYVESEYYCRIITRLYTEENDKLRKERDEAIANNISLQQRTDSAEARAKQLEYEISNQSKELDPLREELEMKQVELEEVNIKLEIANLEIEELNEKLQERLDEYVVKIKDDEKEHAEVIKLNEELQQQLTILVKVGQELLDSKDKHINKLATESDYVDNLSARLKDLLSVEQEVLGLKTKVRELSDKCGSLEDADRMCQQLTEYNNTLEGELTDWREWVLDVEAERKILEELHEHDDQHIAELQKEKKDVEVQLIAMDKENKQLIIEKQDLQKELFELRNKMERQDISAADDYQKYNFAPNKNETDDGDDVGDVAGNPTDDGSTANGDYIMIDTPMNPTDDTMDGRGGGGRGRALDGGGKKLEAIWNENIKLQQQIEEMRSILMSQIDETVEGQGRYVQYELMKQYLPSHSQDVDYRGISVLSLIQKILYKAKAARDLLERFYANPSSSTIQNPNLAMMSHTLCPLILNQENYIRAIQEGFLSIACDDGDEWKQKVLRFETVKFKKILETYGELLTSIENAGKTNELSFDIDKLAEHEKVLKSYIDKQFVQFSPERPKKDEYRCSKNIVLQAISETHYRFQSLSIKLNQFNAKLFDMVHTPAQTTKPIANTPMLATSSSNDMNDDNKYDEEQKDQQIAAAAATTGDYEEDIEDVLKILKIGAVEKLFRLRNDVISSVQQILQYCQPVELGYSKEKYSSNLYKDANKTNIKWGQLKACKHISFNAVQRVSGMLDKITENVKIYQLPRKRVTNINKIIEEEEEQNEEGLITLLEEAYDIVSGVRKIIGSTLHTTEKTTDDMQFRDYEEYKQPFWENKASKFRVLFERQKENMDKIKSQEETIKENHNAVSGIEKELKNKNQTILILTEQNIKEKEKSVNLAEIQKENNEIKQKNEKFKGDILNYTTKISEQTEKIANQSAAIDKYKTAISRWKEKESPLGKTSNTATETTGKRESRIISGVAGKGGFAGNVRHGILLVDHEVEYSSLLQQTIQTLRRKVTELTITKKLTNCQLNLKPLPFTLLREKIINNLNQEIMNKNKNKKNKTKKKKRVKKKKEEEKKEEDEDNDNDDNDNDDNDNDDGDDEKEENKEEKEENKDEEESEYEWVTDDDADDDDDDDENDKSSNESMAELLRLKREKETALKMENKLNLLSTSLNNIRSQPMIIDLTKKKKRNNDLSQEIIGRQMKLRDVHIEYHQIAENIKKQKVENNRNNKIVEIREINDDKRELGRVLGEIEIPNSSLKSLGYNKKHKVLLPSQQFDKLQTSFLW